MAYIPVRTLWNRYANLPASGHWRYCPGCGLGTVQQAVARAIEMLHLDPRRVAAVQGSGCNAVMAEQLGLSGYHGPHGRAVAVGIGMKLGNPDLTVLCLQGDGDSLAIGGNHFVHAARRNVDITVVVFNNFGYSETGGQYGPTTPRGAITETSTLGCPEQPFNICHLARGAGATYIARSTAYHNMLTARLIAAAIQHRGFSVVEVLINCHEIYGKRNGGLDAAGMFKQFRDSSVLAEHARSMAAPDLTDRWVIGELHRDDTRPEFVSEYLALIDRARRRSGLEPSPGGG